MSIVSKYVPNAIPYYEAPNIEIPSIESPIIYSDQELFDYTPELVDNKEDTTEEPLQIVDDTYIKKSTKSKEPISEKEVIFNGKKVNLDNALAILHKNLNKQAKHTCTRAVANALKLQSDYTKSSGVADPKAMYTSLKGDGWTDVLTSDYKPLKGDVWTFWGGKGRYGMHTSIYDGKQWLSYSVDNPRTGGNTPYFWKDRGNGNAHIMRFAREGGVLKFLNSGKFPQEKINFDFNTNTFSTESGIPLYIDPDSTYTTKYITNPKDKKLYLKLIPLNFIDANGKKYNLLELSDDDKLELLKQIALSKFDVSDIQQDIQDELLYLLNKNAENNLATSFENNTANIGGGVVGIPLHLAKSGLDYMFGDRGLSKYEYERALELSERSKIPFAIAAAIIMKNPSLIGTDAAYLSPGASLLSNAVNYTIEHPIETIGAPLAENYAIDSLPIRDLNKEKLKFLTGVINPSLAFATRKYIGSKIAPVVSKSLSGVERGIKEYLNRALTNPHEVQNNLLNYGTLTAAGLAGSTLNAAKDATIGSDGIERITRIPGSDFVFNTLAYGSAMRGLDPIYNLSNKASETGSGPISGELAAETMNLLGDAKNNSLLTSAKNLKSSMLDFIVSDYPKTNSGYIAFLKNNVGEKESQIATAYLATLKKDINIITKRILEDIKKDLRKKSPYDLIKGIKHITKDEKEIIDARINENEFPDLLSFIKANFSVQGREDASKRYEQIHVLTDRQVETSNDRLVNYTQPDGLAPLYRDMRSTNTINVGDEVANHLIKVSGKFSANNLKDSKNLDFNTSMAIRCTRDTGHRTRFKGDVYVLEAKTSIKLPTIALMEKEGWTIQTSDGKGGWVLKPITEGTFSNVSHDITIGKKDAIHDFIYNASGQMITYIKSPNGKVYEVHIDHSGPGSAGSSAVEYGKSGMHNWVLVHVNEATKKFTTNSTNNDFGFKNNGVSARDIAEENLFTSPKLLSTLDALLKYLPPPMAFKLMQERARVNGATELYHRNASRKRAADGDNEYVEVKLETYKLDTKNKTTGEVHEKGSEKRNKYGKRVYSIEKSEKYKKYLKDREKAKKEKDKMLESRYNAVTSNKSGGVIYIKEKNKGKFTDYCGGKVTNACIAKAKASGNKTLIKRATFADNARKWNK